VPPQFTGTQLIVPHPVNGVLYLKLRDDPGTVQMLTLPVTLISLAASKAAAAESQPGATPTAAHPAPQATPSEKTSPTTSPETTPAVPPATGSAAQGEQTQTPAPKPN
jgi:hypothetical protein